MSLSGIFSKVKRRLSMAFADRNKEERFLSQRRDETAENLRWACVVGAAIMIGFIWQDTLISATGYKAIIIRIFGALPVSALAWYLGGNLGVRRFISYISASFWLIYTCLTIALCISYGSGPCGLTSSIGLGSLLIILFGVFTFSNLRLWASLMVGLLILLAYTVSVALWTEDVFGDFIMGDFLTIVALMMGLAAKTVYTERAQRRQFETSELLHQSYTAVESQVRERTAELQAANTILTTEVAARETMEAHLRESETRYRMLFEDARDGMALADTETGLLMNCNEALCRMVERKKEELVGQPQSILHPPETDGNKFTQIFRQHRDEDVGHAREAHLLSKGGKLIPVEIAATRIRMNNRYVLMGIFRDITEREKTEWEILRLLAQSDRDRLVLLGILEDQRRTEKTLAKSNEDLKTALEDLKRTQAQIVREERLAALGQMASGIAHDFNNVLVPIVGFSDAMLSDPGILDNRAEALSMLKDISTAAQDAKQIVHRMRLIRESDDDSAQAPVDLNKIIMGALELTRTRWKDEMDAKGTSLTIVKRLAADKPVLGNESQLREVLMNLILNAVDAMPTGGTLTLSSSMQDSQVTIDVSDTGTGMPDKVKERCGEPFFTTKGAKGTGLGLSLVQGIVRRHNGTMNIESALGRGTTIHMSFPPAPAESKGEEQETGKTLRLRSGQVDKAGAPAPLRILVADDETKSRDLIARFLKKDGHSVETARTGWEAIDKAKAEVFDLVITDRAMPEGNGDIVARSVKAHSPQTRIILLTGFGDIMKDEGDRPAGVDKIVCKPVTRDELRQAIEETMKQKG